MTLVGLRSIEEACQKTIFDFFAECDRVWVRDDIYTALLKSGPWSGEMRFQHFKTGTLIDVDLLAFKIHDDNGTPLYIATVTRDLTEKRLAEAEKAKLEEQLFQAKKLDRPPG
jgi:PAS domain S-box-containing protein